MSNTRKNRLATAVKIVLDAILTLLIGGSAFLLLWIVIAPWIQDQLGIWISTSFPVTVGMGSPSMLEIQFISSPNGVNIPTFVEGAQGALRLETTRWNFFLISNLAKLLTALGVAIPIYLLRQVLKSIVEGNPFEEANVKRIRWIGYLILLVGFLRAPIEYFSAEAILKQLPASEPMLGPPSPFNAEIILASLLVLVLAQVWSYGLELERDKALTI